MLLGGGKIGCTGGFRRFKIPKVDRAAVNLDLGTPALVSRKPNNTPKSGGVVLLQIGVPMILRMRGLAQIAPSIAVIVNVTMINDHFRPSTSHPLHREAMGQIKRVIDANFDITIFRS